MNHKAVKTKKGWFYIVPIYYCEKTNVLSGRGFISNGLLELMIEIHHLFLFFTSHFFDIELGYPIKITGDKNDNRRNDECA